jgi:hypothetical protein
MERKLNRRIADYVSTLKNDVKKKAIELKFIEPEKIESLISYLYEYNRLTLSIEDVSKRKRVKNSIPRLNRCHAKKANGDQCTRKQKESCIYCGTHEKGTPHGVVSSESNVDDNIIFSEVFAEEIGGIVYYLDKNKNVFNTEDIMNEKENPRIIAKYEYEDGVYHIPELGL